MNAALTKKPERSLTRAQQIFLYMAPCPALAFFKIWASTGREPHSLLIAASGMLAYCTICLAVALRWDKPTYFDWTACAYFLVLVLLLGMWPEASAPILTEYAVTGIYICLFAAAFLPPMIGLDPFTYHYAKKHAPREVWGSSIFVTINRIVTFVWVGIFATCIVLSLYPSVITRALIPIALIIGVGVQFSLRFANRYLKRLGLPASAEMRKSRRPDAFETPSDANGATASDLAVSPPEHISSEFPEEPSSRPAVPTDRSQFHKEAIMKVVAVNSSPRSAGISKTVMMLDALVEGMRDAGADVETFHLRKMTVKNCIGCFTCWTKTPGVCVQKDDMTNELFPKLLQAGIAVYATPLYHYTVNASMKAFIERSLPVVEPWLVRDSGTTTHPLRQALPKVVMISVAGFPEASVFARLSSYVNFLFRNMLVAEIYRPAAEMLSLPEMSETRKDILEATTEAGRELIHSMSVSEQTMERITRPVGDFDSMAKMANLFWKSCIREGLTPAEFHQRKLVPRPDSIETFMMIMARAFNAGNAAGIKAVMQFNFSGEVEGTCHFRIESGRIAAKGGEPEKADLTIESPFEVWMDVMTGKADGQQMFMQQKYRTFGDQSLLMRMKDLFGNQER